MTKITKIIQYVNKHLNDNNTQIIEWINNYLHTSYRYSKQNSDKSWLEIQPGYPNKFVLSYKIISNSYDYKCLHKSTRLVLIFTDNTEIDISLYKFKQFVKRKYNYV